VVSNSVAVKPFTIAVGDKVLGDLRHRIQRTRWPAPPGYGFSGLPPRPVMTSSANADLWCRLMLAEQVAAVLVLPAAPAGR
jgi:hypothetical protein